MLIQEAVIAFKNSPRSILRARSQPRKIRCVHVFLLISSLFHFTFAFLMFCISLYMNKTAAHGMVSLASLLARYHQIHHQLFDFLMLCLFHFLLLSSKTSGNGSLKYLGMIFTKSQVLPAWVFLTNANLELPQVARVNKRSKSTLCVEHYFCGAHQFSLVNEVIFWENPPFFS